MSEMLKLLAPIVLVYALVLAALLFVIKRILSGDAVRAVERVKEVENELR